MNSSDLSSSYQGSTVFKYGSSTKGQGIPLNILMDVLDFTDICCRNV